MPTQTSAMRRALLRSVGFHRERIIQAGALYTVSVQIWDGLRLGMLAHDYRLVQFWQLSCAAHGDHAGRLGKVEFGLSFDRYGAGCL